MGRGNPSEKGILRVIAYCYGEKLHTPSFLRKILTHVMTHVTKRTDEPWPRGIIFSGAKNISIRSVWHERFNSI